MNKRLKELRKTLNLTQEKFGAKIYVKGNTIAQWESGRNLPSESSIKYMCTIYKVNENWLRNNIGEMFLKPSASSLGRLDKLAEEHDLDSASYIAIEKFIELNPTLRSGIISYFCDVIDAIKTISSQQ